MGVSFDGQDTTKMTTEVFDGKPYEMPEMVWVEGPFQMNLANANARLFLEFLGIDPGDEPSGDVSIPDARRAIMKAKALFEKNANGFTREEAEEIGARGARVFTSGLTTADLGNYLERFERLVEHVAARGATHVQWA